MRKSTRWKTKEKLSEQKPAKAIAVCECVLVLYMFNVRILISLENFLHFKKPPTTMECEVISENCDVGM